MLHGMNVKIIYTVLPPCLPSGFMAWYLDTPAILPFVCTMDCCINVM